MLSSVNLFGLIFMLLDHIGYYLYPDLYILRLLGRLAFPLFAYQVSLSITYTHDLKNYISKLYLFAVISFIPYCLFYGHFQFNILFTFFFSSLIIYYYSSSKWHDKYKLLLLYLFIICIHEYLDYSFAGIVLVLLFYYLHDQSIYSVIFCLIVFYIIYSLSLSSFINPEIFSLLSCFYICNYFRINFKIPKLSFYYIYPVHLVLLILTKTYIFN